MEIVLQALPSRSDSWPRTSRASACDDRGQHLRGTCARPSPSRRLCFGRSPQAMPSRTCDPHGRRVDHRGYAALSSEKRSLAAREPRAAWRSRRTRRRSSRAGDPDAIRPASADQAEIGHRFPNVAREKLHDVGSPMGRAASAVVKVVAATRLRRSQTSSRRDALRLGPAQPSNMVFRSRAVSRFSNAADAGPPILRVARGATIIPVLESSFRALEEADPPSGNRTRASKLRRLQPVGEAMPGSSGAHHLTHPVADQCTCQGRQSCRRRRGPRSAHAERPRRSRRTSSRTMRSSADAPENSRRAWARAMQDMGGG